MNPAESSLQVRIFGAEPWTETGSHEIRRRAKLMRMILRSIDDGRVQQMNVSKAKDGPVIWEDFFYPEIIGPLTDDAAV